MAGCELSALGSRLSALGSRLSALGAAGGGWRMLSCRAPLCHPEPQARDLHVLLRKDACRSLACGSG